MKVVIAIDSFKGSLTSLEAGNAICRGILNADNKTQVCVRPIADGGEGTAEALIQSMNANREQTVVTGPLGKPVTCSYGIVEETRTAIIEISGAAGITLIDSEDRNPMETTTFGVGEVILDAIKKGCRRFIVGIGGSSTNDGGIGMLQGLGFGILDKNGDQVSFGAKGLKDIMTINEDHVPPELRDCKFIVACDVNNPLCGTNGCSAVFGPQKGADTETIVRMDQWLQRFSEISRTYYPESNAFEPGSGAAGGLGFAFLTFLHAHLSSGIDLILKETEFEKYVYDADFVITGEGRLDAQTVMGKVPSGVAAIAAKHCVPVIAFSGSVSNDAKICNNYGITAYFPILRNVVTLDEAMKHDIASRNLTNTAEQVFRLIKVLR